MDEEAMNLGSRTKIQGNSHLHRGPRTLELGKWRAREENLPPRWPETSMILPPTDSLGKSNVRPFVRP